MSQALYQVLKNLTVAAICFGLSLNFLFNRERKLGTYWTLAAITVPMAYVIVWAFTSYAFIAFSIFASFWLCFIMKGGLSRTVVGLGTGAVLTGLLSAFVAWMSFRDRIRETIWGGGGIGERLQVVLEAVKGIELLSPYNFDSLDLLNTRLNQNIFVGKVAEYHDKFPELRLHGEQLILLPFAIIPRQLWPGKPEMGGSKLLAEHTGQLFSDSATFGAGPIIEFYINFGLAGVFFGMILLGAVIRYLDLKAIRSLRALDLLDFVRWFTVGIAFVAPLTDLFFMFNTALMTFIVLTFVRELLRRREGRDRSQQHFRPGRF